MGPTEINVWLCRGQESWVLTEIRLSSQEPVTLGRENAEYFPASVSKFFPPRCLIGHRVVLLLFLGSRCEACWVCSHRLSQMLMLLVLPVGSDHSDLAPALDILALIGGRLTSLGVLLSESVVCLFVRNRFSVLFTSSHRRESNAFSFFILKYEKTNKHTCLCLDTTNRWQTMTTKCDLSSGIFLFVPEYECWSFASLLAKKKVWNRKFFPLHETSPSASSLCVWSNIIYYSQQQNN